MKEGIRSKLCALVTGLGMLLSGTVQADEGRTDPLYQGGYLAPMASYVMVDQAFDTDDGLGAVLALGYRHQWWAIELEGVLTLASGKGDNGDTDLRGANLSGLVFPFSGLPNLYGVAGVGGLEVKDYPGIDNTSFTLGTLEAGVGHLFAFSFGNYEMALRAEVRYRKDRREKDISDVPRLSLDVPRNFDDVLINVGLHLPFGFRVPAPVVETPVAVVAPLAVCADTQDNDGDGLIDFPADPGCSAAEDNDETDPPQCSDGKDNDGDGLIDFPADKGCTGADDTDEVDPCKTPAPGERISLKGCGTGDIIVLRGVNFEFDKASLTANAKTILDNVAEELKAYPEIKVELGGHTDAKGSDEYNQNLSERRAASVLKYLSDAGVDAGRLTSAGYGEAQPVADNETGEGRELNRRVELKVTAGLAPPG